MSRKTHKDRPAARSGAPARPAPPSSPPASRPARPPAAGGPPALARRLLRPLLGPHGPAVALLVLLHLGLYSSVFFGGELLLGSGTDILSAQIPYRTAAAERLRSGELPLWDPGHFAGAPLLANGQSGATYPPYWLLLPLSPGRAVSWSFALHVLLASLTTYALAWRLRRVSRPPAPPGGAPDDDPLPVRARPLAAAGPLLAGALVSLGGGVQAHVYAGHVNLIEAFAWLPAALLAFDVVLGRPGPLPATGLGLVLGLQLLAGHPQVSFLTALALAVWTLALVPGRPPLRPRLTGLAWAAGGAALGALLAGLLLVPLFELAADSHRQLAQDPWDFATEFAAQPLTLLQLGLAHPFGLPTAGAPAWWSAFGRWEPQSWVGAPALLLAALGVAVRLDRRRVALAVLAVAAVVLALGDATPLYRAFAAVVPGATLFRVPARFLLLAGLALPLLAGLGLDALVALREPRRVRVALIAATALLLVPLLGLRGSLAEAGPESTAAAWASAHAGPATRPLLERGDAGRVRELVRAPASAAVDDALLWLLLAAGLGAAAAFGPRRRGAAPGGLPVPALLGGGLALLVTGHAAAFAGAWVVTKPADPRPPLTAALLSAAATTAGHDRVVWWEDRRWNVGMQAPALRNVGGYDPAITWRLNDVLNLRAGAGADAIPRHKLWMLWPPPRGGRPGPAWDLLAGRALVTRDAARMAQLPGLVPVADPAATGSPYSVLENLRALPRAGVSFGAVVEPDPAQRLALLSRPDFDPRRALVLDEPPPESAPAAATGDPAAAGTVAWEADEPERVVLLATSDRPAYVWLSDTWRPGWEATVDGAPAPLLRANHAFRAVPVPAGEHRVELRYRPGAVRLGAGLSLLGALGLAALGLVRRRRVAPNL